MFFFFPFYKQDKFKYKITKVSIFTLFLKDVLKLIYQIPSYTFKIVGNNFTSRM